MATGDTAATLPDPAVTSRDPAATPLDPGATSRGPGAISREPAAASPTPGATSSKPGAASLDPGATSRGPGAISREPAAASPTPGATSPKQGATSSKQGATSSKQGATSSKQGATSSKPGATSSKPGGAESRAADRSEESVVVAAQQVRAGAERAAAERNRRRTTPLLIVPEDPPPAVPDAEIPKPSMVPASSAASMVLSIANQIGQSVLTAITEVPGAEDDDGQESSPIRTETTGRPEPTAAAGTNVFNSEAPTTQPPAEEHPDRLLEVLEFLRSRLAGDFEVDAFGFDPEFADAVPLNLLRPLYQHWFRVEVRGAENIPAEGGALIVANHSGAVPIDALMTAVAVREERERHLRILGGDLVFQTPFLAGLARRGGATLASNADAERLLSSGELVGVWPEGYKGIGKPFSERYKLQRFGRGGFVSAALRTGVPIVPCSIVGAEEIYPIIAQVPALARLLGLPYLPITPFFPLLGPLGAVPLPSKWLIEFGTPVPTTGPGGDQVAAAEDPILVFDLTDRIRQTIQQTLYSLLVQRRSVFF
ncbi:1-acyl-sn-glycerol-3-phosphate acyltransferase [Kineosporia sp. NBRC 101677]|uniref:1-acyl-sn-glycerol-3-phosphate acyltransferase n=1 Tax=Kineosporia sp. NBRC 101677 TaxID=3032197 RepID=UPI0025552408|nr:1-acyl-sn-glycerol-3-phosphate acyltransferase [Kineosporia sp. NBRC 101677]